MDKAKLSKTFLTVFFVCFQTKMKNGDESDDRFGKTLRINHKILFFSLPLTLEFMSFYIRTSKNNKRDA